MDVKMSIECQINRTCMHKQKQVRAYSPHYHIRKHQKNTRLKHD